jgi:hypothetical protein
VAAYCWVGLVVQSHCIQLWWYLVEYPSHRLDHVFFLSYKWSRVSPQAGMETVDIRILPVLSLTSPAGHSRYKACSQNTESSIKSYGMGCCHFLWRCCWKHTLGHLGWCSTGRCPVLHRLGSTTRAFLQSGFCGMNHNSVLMGHSCLLFLAAFKSTYMSKVLAIDLLP